jgi:ATP-binding cassette subfamily C protein
LDVSGAAALVRRLPEGFETVVGERGALLSGGERQRLALARALLRKPRLLILDEALNGLEQEAEREIYERLASLKTRPTIILIAHRMVNLDVCDRIIRFGEGHFAPGRTGGRMHWEDA